MDMPYGVDMVDEGGRRDDTEELVWHYMFLSQEQNGVKNLVP